MDIIIIDKKFSCLCRTAIIYNFTKLSALFICGAFNIYCAVLYNFYSNFMIAFFNFCF